ncbi:hypothetical protein WA026_002693 [Henosepilachna vigintioctopunctata]|uniref:Uncharacterized protein n=1 Tax=Henosepilachna vigintioctopunctata TaxID=420089 RepID=A0AAW1TVM8_9CUCU
MDLVKTTPGFLWRRDKEVVQDGKYENCTGCNLIPQLLDIITELNGSIINLKIQISNLNKRDDHNETENIIEEISDRQFRARNVIIYNIPESDSGNDCEQVKNILQTITPEIKYDKFKIFRIGKKTNSSKRLKVILESREQSLNVMRNKRKLREYDNNIKVGLYETQMQKKLL